MVVIEGIPINDLAYVMNNVIIRGEHQMTEDVDIFMSTKILAAGVPIMYEYVGGPEWTRHYLKGRRWSFWMDLSSSPAISATASNRVVTLAVGNDENYVRFIEKFHRLKDYKFDGDYLDYQNDMAMVRVAGLL